MADQTLTLLGGCGLGDSLLTAQFDQQEDTERAKEWKQVLDSTIAVLQHQLRLHPQTGLLADFLVYDHSERCYKPCEGKVLEKDNDGEYNWNSCRYLKHLHTVETHFYCLLSSNFQCRDGVSDQSRHFGIEKSCYIAYILLCPSLFELIKQRLQALSCLFCCGNLKRGDANGIHVCDSRIP